MAKEMTPSNGAHVKIPNVDVEASDRSVASFFDTCLKFYLATLEWAQNNPVLFALMLLFIGWWIYVLRLKARDRLEMVKQVGEQKGENGHSGGSESEITQPIDSTALPRIPSPAGQVGSNQIAPSRQPGKEDGHD